MKFLKNSLIVFLVLVVVLTLINIVSPIEFGQTNYFAKRGVFFLIAISLFPRLTLLFSSVAFGGFLWWLGFFFFPRILVAVLATVAYFQTNPFLVVMSWMIALGGEIFEKQTLRHRTVYINVQRGMGTGHRRRSQNPHYDKNVIDAEYKNLN